MTTLLPQLIKPVLDFLLPRNWKKAFWYLTVISIYLLYTINENLRDAKSLIQQLKSENEIFKAENIDLKSKLVVRGLDTELHGDIQKNVDDFVRDWDTSSFYFVEGDTFCPKIKGKNNYQRIFYKYDSPLTVSHLTLKFQMVDQNSKITNYAQRLVVGLKIDEAVFSELDIPTRDSQVVNFRVASESGKLVAGGEGKQINSPIKDKSTINLDFRTQPKHGQETTQIVELDYVSVYGGEKKSISYDAKVNDSRPETARANLFIGSYMGGCIKIIGWHAS